SQCQVRAAEASRLEAAQTLPTAERREIVDQRKAAALSRGLIHDSPVEPQGARIAPERHPHLALIGQARERKRRGARALKRERLERSVEALAGDRRSPSLPPVRAS